MSPASAQQDALLGRRLGERYRIESFVARGGMATVYRARDERLDRRVAVKVLNSDYAADAAFAARFLGEARTAAAFSHPNVAHVYDSGSDGDVQYIVLELLDEHRALRDEVREHGALEPVRAATLALDVLAGLDPLHRLGMLHCDVKSGNVMIGPGGAKLIDFGIARPQRQAGSGQTSIGSLHAMSPEQLRGEPLTPASDVFAVGVVLYEALTGRVPFPGDTPDEVAAAHQRGPSARPSELRDGLAPRLDDVVLQALKLDPRRRFASAEAMTVALRAARAAQRQLAGVIGDDDTTTFYRVPPPSTAQAPAHRPSAAPAPPAPPRPGARRRRDWSTPVAVSLAAIGVPALVVALLLVGGDRDPAVAQPTATPATTAPAPSATPGSNLVAVPNVIGMSERKAEEAARAAGLNWRIEWQVRQGQRPGIYDQEPPAGEMVEPGSRFVMYAYRNR